MSRPYTYPHVPVNRRDQATSLPGLQVPISRGTYVRDTGLGESASRDTPPPQPGLGLLPPETRFPEHPG